jgi:DNA polymerase I
VITLLDGDIFCYRCAAACSFDSLDLATYQLNDLLRRVLKETGATEHVLYLNGSESFRRQLSDSYKANRTAPKPHHLEPLREYLITEWKAQLSSDGLETDDEIGVQATKFWHADINFCIASIDKDLKQLPGKHYNFVKGEWSFVTPMEGAQNFWKQMLSGDPSDNIKGVTGIGPVKARKAIDPLAEEVDMYTLVNSLYSDKEQFTTNAKLLWILKHSRNPDEVVSHYLSLQKLAEAAE